MNVGMFNVVSEVSEYVLISFFLKIYFILFYFFGLFAFSRAAPVACGSSQARGLIRTGATSLHQSHSNVGSEPCLRPTPQLTATPDS